MKNHLRYTLIAEGFAEYKFIPAYMEWVGANHKPLPLKISRTRIQIPVTKNPSVSKVLELAGQYAAQSFTDDREPCDLCIVGIDLDKPDHTDELEYHAQRLKELEDSMGKVYRNYKNQIQLYVPIQAIDCWVSYIQQQATPNSLESTSKHETKKRVYGSSNPDRQRIENTVKDVVARADFAQLAKQSRSFRHFHQQILNFLTNYTSSS
jgi:hypothetical protein